MKVSHDCILICINNFRFSNSYKSEVCSKYLQAILIVMKRSTIAVFAVFAVVAVIVVGLFSFNSTIQAKSDQGQSLNYSDKIVVIKGYDGARQTFIITQTELGAIQSNLVDSSTDTKSPANATLENVEDFLLIHSNKSP